MAGRLIPIQNDTHLFEQNLNLAQNGLKNTWVYLKTG